MELIRCDQCEKELRRFERYFTMELHGPAPMAANREMHICSESCGVVWFTEHAPTVSDEQPDA